MLRKFVRFFGNVRKSDNSCWLETRDDEKKRGRWPEDKNEAGGRRERREKERVCSHMLDTTEETLTCGSDKSSAMKKSAPPAPHLIASSVFLLLLLCFASRFVP